MPKDIQPPTDSSTPGIVEEWKKASTKEKMVIVAIVAVVLFVMYYMFKNSSVSSSPSTINRGTATAPGLSYGTGTVYSTPSPTTTTVGAVSSPPSQPGGSFINGLIKPGQYTGPSYSNLKWGTTYNYNGTLYQLVTGPNGRLWGYQLNSGQSPYTKQQVQGKQGTLLIG